MVVDQNIQDITTMVNTIVAVTIPAVISLALAIINFINHKTNSSKIHSVTDKASAAFTKAEEVDKKVQANEDKITSGIAMAQDLSPAVKDAIVTTHPKVIELQTKVDTTNAQLKQLQDYVNTIAPQQPAQQPTK